MDALELYFMLELSRMVISDFQQGRCDKAEYHAKTLYDKLTAACEKRGLFKNA